MFRDELPRLYELKDQIKQPNSPNAYFQDFESKLRNPHIKKKYLDLEQELRGLDSGSWKSLREEASPYLIKNNNTKRGWESLFNILNQARAYNYLKKIGCTNIQSIPPARKKTPDLQGMMDSVKCICEVKTINVSEEEVNANKEAMDRGYGPVRTVECQLGSGFFKKLNAVIKKAQGQLVSDDKVKRLLYINLNFDLWGEYKDRHFKQIDQYFVENPVHGIEIVFHR